MDKPFQRKGSESNAHVGRDFEEKIQEYFAKQGLVLNSGVAVPVGINGKKLHSFDLGNKDGKVLLECKAHRWTEGGNVPSAKLTVWNEAMFFFHASPSGYRKLLVVLRDFSARRNETLGEYYIRTYSHLIPDDVEVWEYDESEKNGKKIKWPENKALKRIAEKAGSRLALCSAGTKRKNRPRRTLGAALRSSRLARRLTVEINNKPK